MKLCVLDPGIQKHDGTPSDNLGDLIIQDAVNRELSSLFGKTETISYSTHEPLSHAQLKVVADSSLVFVGGTNLLSSNMSDIQFNNPVGTDWVWRQWKISLYDALKLKNAILLGVGWWQYQRPPGPLTRLLLKSVLSSTILHSVRDSYTEAMLRSIGIDNVINTGCPTMWPINDMDMDNFPNEKAPNVLVMITDYLKDFEADRKLFQMLSSKYQNVYLWPQGSLDKSYLAELGISAQVLDRDFGSFKSFVKSGIPFDYVGTRLHGGIWCLLNKKRSLILAVDNRATEIAKDTGLPVVSRADFAAINQWIDQPSKPSIRLPVESINRWKKQFRNPS
jgi:polysaccharide pyruvyl transferase WcaK-like protein